MDGAMNSHAPAPPWQRPRALLLVWLCRFIAATLVALPIATAVSAPLAGFPAGDRLLFAPGATYLVEVLRLSHQPLVGAARTSGWLLIALGFAQLVPVGALLVALIRPKQLSVADLLVHGVRHLPEFSLLGGLTLLAQAIVLVALGFPTLVFRSGMRAPLGAPAADLSALAAIFAVLVLVGLLGAVQDLARAAIVTSETGIRPALTAALRTFTARPLTIAAEWLWRVLARAALIGGAAATTAALALDQPGTVRVATLVVVQQGAIFLAVYLRADWLRRALVHVSCPSRGSLACRAEDSVSPADPNPSPDASPDDAIAPSPGPDAPQGHAARRRSGPLG
jgi:hypothetical protein